MPTGPVSHALQKVTEKGPPLSKGLLKGSASFPVVSLMATRERMGTPSSVTAGLDCGRGEIGGGAWFGEDLFYL